MARSDLLINLVKAGTGGERELFDKTVSAIIAEERSKQHHILADTLSKAAERQRSTSLLQSPVQSARANLVFERQAEASLADLILSHEIRITVTQMIEEQQRADLLRSFNLEPRSRVLLTGPPGNGKTSLAEAIAAELAVPFFVVRYDSLIASYLGETAQRLRELFQYARLRRCVLFFDEFDALGKERGDIQETGEIKRVVNSLLLEIDSLPSYVVLIAATNHPELLDRATWRRFQIKTVLAAPTSAQIADWFDLIVRRFPEFSASGSNQLSAKLVGNSFSELEDMVQDVMRRRVLDGLNGTKSGLAEVLHLWVSNLKSKGRANGKFTNTHLPNSGNGSQSKNGRGLTAASPANSRQTKRKTNATNSTPRASVHPPRGRSTSKPGRS